jgi:hypothetical protein
MVLWGSFILNLPSDHSITSSARASRYEPFQAARQGREIEALGELLL